MPKNIYKEKFESLVVENLAREGEHQLEIRRLREKAIELSNKIEACLSILTWRKQEKE